MAAQNPAGVRRKVRKPNIEKEKTIITIILRIFIVNASVWYINILTGK